VLPVNLFYVCALCDGRHSVVDIQADYMRKFGEMIFSEKVKEIVGKLDDCLFLESPHFEEEKGRMLEVFRGDPVRHATHAGSAYESEAEALRRQLDGCYADPQGPQPKAADDPAAVAPPAGGQAPTTLSESPRLEAVMAPHIDPRRGGACYAWSYAEVASRSPAETFVILGICHTPTTRRFALTKKHFETPLGTVETDHALVDSLAGRCTVDFFADEYAHAGEHSIEFQVLFLQHLFAARRQPGRGEPKIVPILCSSFFHGEAAQEAQAGGSAVPTEAADFLSALRETLEEGREDVCIIAAVDLSHLGRRFGQDVRLSPGFTAEAERNDRKMLESVMARDPEAFLDGIRRENDRRNVCGVPAIYTMLSVLGPGSAKLLRYGQAEEPQTQSLVTFASAAFYAGEEPKESVPPLNPATA